MALTDCACCDVTEGLSNSSCIFCYCLSCVLRIKARALGPALRQQPRSSHSPPLLCPAELPHTVAVAVSSTSPVQRPYRESAVDRCRKLNNSGWTSGRSSQKYARHRYRPVNVPELYSLHLAEVHVNADRQGRQATCA